jgi:hypothetical protein
MEESDFVGSVADGNSERERSGCRANQHQRTLIPFCLCHCECLLIIYVVVQDEVLLTTSSRTAVSTDIEGRRRRELEQSKIPRNT